MSLEELRERLGRVDAELLELVAERQRLVSGIGRLKRQQGRATRDFHREKEVLERARATAAGLELPPSLADDLMRLLIRSSLTTQEQDRVVAEGQGSGLRALVIGGHGKMGRWFAGFLASQGFAVAIADPAGPVEGYLYVADWREELESRDLVVVAAPLAATVTILEQLAVARPAGLVFDIGSLKSPLRRGLEALLAAGTRVTSLHPMFGPDTALLSGRHVIFVEIGAPDATREARELFAPTMAELVTMGLDDHDRLIAYVLGLSHALNIAFAVALADSGEEAQELARLSSTTFDAQLQVAGRVTGENPRLYYEIQALNEHGMGPLDALRCSLDKLQTLVRDADESGFVDLMLGGRQYLERWSRAGPD